MSCAFRRVPCQLARFSRPLPPSAASSPTGAIRMSWAPKVAPSHRFTAISVRAFSRSAIPRQDGGDAKAREPKQKGLDEEAQEAAVKANQVKRPWLREDADKPPAEKDSTSSRTKGKLLTTPTRLLKLILPLPIRVEKDKENNNNREYGRALSINDTIQPLALLVHPQQPLSYVERLIQAELPPVVEDGKEKIPNIYFRAEDAAGSENRPTTRQEARAADQKSQSAEARPHVASYSGLGHEAEEDYEENKSWVRWSSSTEMGDFIRDAARGREFAIEVEGYNIEMRVSVPSFNDRTYYMRLRLRRMSQQIDKLASIKKECDELAYKSAHRLAQGGFVLLSGWWAVVYYVTFQTDWGWDLVEPVTYLVGLTTIMGGYLWFLFISRDLSYKGAMNVTVSKRQNALYETKGFDIHRWEQIVQEANGLRREIKNIAGEYDVEWDEMKDLSYSKQVKQVLEKQRTKQGYDDEDAESDEEEQEAQEEERKVKSEMVHRDQGGKRDRD